MKFPFFRTTKEEDTSESLTVIETLLNEKEPFSFTEPDNESKEHQQPQLDQPATTKRELYSYYLYYNGNNGFTIYGYMPIIFQYLAYKGGFNPETPNVKGCDMTNTFKPCHVNWINSPNGIPASSMLLYVQSIAFSIQFLLFTSLGSLADYGRWNRHILLAATVISVVFQALPITLVNDDGSHWNVMMCFMIVALIAYGATLVFYAAVFPTLSDNLPIVRYTRLNPELNKDEKDQMIEKWREHISAVSTTYSNIGFLVMTGLLSGVSYVSWEGKHDFPANTPHTLGNAPVYNFISTVVCAVYLAIFAFPYFFCIPKGRQGRELPKSASYLTIGWKSIFKAVKEIKKLKYLFMYIIAYFMFADAVSTIGQMITIIQGELTGFSAQQNTIFSLVTAITSILGCLLFLWISRTFKIKTKTSLLIIVILTMLQPLWGCFGIFFNNFGIKTHGELWVLNICQGLFTAPIWAWQQTLLAELTPKGHENLFFGLFGIVNKASSWIGPVVIGAITQSTSNIWYGWPFVFGLFLVATIIICFIDVDQAKLDLIEYERNATLDAET